MEPELCDAAALAFSFQLLDFFLFNFCNANPSIFRFLNLGRKMSARGAGSRALLSPRHSVMQ